MEHFLFLARRGIPIVWATGVATCAPEFDRFPCLADVSGQYRRLNVLARLSPHHTPPQPANQARHSSRAPPQRCIRPADCVLSRRVLRIVHGWPIGATEPNLRPHRPGPGAHGALNHPSEVATPNLPHSVPSLGRSMHQHSHAWSPVSIPRLKTSLSRSVPGRQSADICTRWSKSVDRAKHPSVRRLVSSGSPPRAPQLAAYHDAG